VIALRAALIVALAALLVGAGWWGRGVVAQRDLATQAAAIAAERQAMATASQAASELARAAERAAEDRIHQIATEANDAIRSAYQDAAAADRVAGQLRDHIARLAAQWAAGAAAEDPESAAAGPPAAGPGLVLAELFGRADDRAGELAAFADQAHAAGLACQRAYESLSRRR
jgi:hypothetical protein